jgi:hypothetical protein
MLGINQIYQAFRDQKGGQQRTSLKALDEVLQTYGDGDSQLLFDYLNTCSSLCHSSLGSYHSVTVTLSLCHSVTLSLCHFVTLSLCHCTLSCHSVTLSLCHSVTALCYVTPHLASITLSSCHPVTLSPVTLSPCHLVTLSFTLSPCYPVTLSLFPSSSLVCLMF